jgi:predicted RNase H-like HicB family nuclease
MRRPGEDGLAQTTDSGHLWVSPIGEAQMADYEMKLITRYDGMVVATFPDLPGVSALGVDDEDARSEGLRALSEALAEREPA